MFKGLDESAKSLLSLRWEMHLPSASSHPRTFHIPDKRLLLLRVDLNMIAV